MQHNNNLRVANLALVPSAWMTFSENDPDLFTNDLSDDEERGFVTSFCNSDDIERLEEKRLKYMEEKSTNPSGVHTVQHLPRTQDEATIAKKLSS